MFRWFEHKIDPFSGSGNVRPPSELGAFYWHFVRQAWPGFVALLVVGFIGAVIEASLFAFVGSLVDMMRAAKSPSTFIEDHWGTLTAMAVVAAVIRPLVSFVHDLIKHQMIGGAFTTLIRWQSHAYVLRQSLGFFQNDFAGRVANKVMQSGPAVRESVVASIDAVWFVAVYWLTALALFGAADPLLIGPLILWFVLYAGVLWYFIPRLKAKAIETSEARSMLTGRIVDSYTNILTVKLFAHTEREDEYARSAMREQLDKLTAQLRLTTLMETSLFAINGVLLVLMSGLAIWLWSLEAVTIGAIALVIGLTIRIVNMSGWIMWTVAGIFENLGIAHESMETVSRPWSVVDYPDARAIEVKRGEIVYENVTFRYGRARTLDDSRQGGIIDGLSLRIAAGEKVGLVGRSGAGKSTLVSLLLRFYDLESGRILIDGQDISEATQESLRAEIGLVTQDTSLLHRSVIDNILYGRPDAGIAAAKEAAARAHAAEFIDGLEDLSGRQGYLAHVGERGVKLSGGQRQRVAIARVLLKNAPILVLDEATSALDSEVEAAIQDSLNELMAGKTVIAIAHRLSTIAAMDRLIIMDQGRIVEQGSHSELLRRGGVYANLWKRQSGGFLGTATEAAE
ncbi:MAG: ABC transporter ATP-binding protein [Hyphomicrobium sp.]|nr:ABC transporter ATP-binding protein [Hyphomicrobium sp.]